MDLWVFERELIKKGYSAICGVDEAGRGPLAGDVFAAAVILPFEIKIDGLNDSKKLSPKKRDELYDIITSVAVAWSVGRASNTEIDEINILNATFLAMNRALDGLSSIPEIAIIDGNRYKGRYNHLCVVKGDCKSASVAAASIIAKVERDRYMGHIAEIYPGYGFEKHKGYPTKEHYEAIARNGVLDIHRKTFLRKLTYHDQQSS